MLAAVILAAGESRRMGRPKALLPYHGRAFLEHLMGVVTHQRIGTMRVVLGAGAEEIRDKLKLDPATVVVNPDWEKGQLSSIQAALGSLPRGATEGMLLCLVDHPLITSRLVASLIEQFDSTSKAIVIPTYKGKRGHPAIFRSTLYDELLAAPLNLGARAVVWSHAADVLEVPTEDGGVVLNLNDPETLKRAMADA